MHATVARISCGITAVHHGCLCYSRVVALVTLHNLGAAEHSHGLQSAQQRGSQPSVLFGQVAEQSALGPITNDIACLRLANIYSHVVHNMA